MHPLRSMSITHHTMTMMIHTTHRADHEPTTHRTHRTHSRLVLDPGGKGSETVAEGGREDYYHGIG
jgi:hypothetical protein